MFAFISVIWNSGLDFSYVRTIPCVFFSFEDPPCIHQGLSGMLKTRMVFLDIGDSDAYASATKQPLC